MKIWLDLSCDYRIQDAYQLGSSEILAASGKNLGNLVFRKSLFSLIEDISDFHCLRFSDLTEEIIDAARIVVISCANWLEASERAEKRNLTRALLIEKFSCPVIPIGLGLQATKNETVSLGVNSVKLISVLSSKCNHISVRDFMAADVLAKHGVTNVVVTGCPSNLINLNLSFATYNSKRGSVKDWNSGSFFISEISGGNPETKSIAEFIVKLLAMRNSKYVLQTPALLPFALGETKELHKLYKDLSGYSKPEVLSILNACLTYFCSVDDWLLSARQSHFSFGMRIHGTMVPLQAGTPSIMIAHDARTSGLAATMNVPSIDASLFGKISGDRFQVFEDIFFSKVSLYLDTRLKLAICFKDFLASNRLIPSPRLIEYISS